jgi:hypothetical protein
MKGMKQRNVLFGLSILLGCAFLLFTGCPSGLTDEAGVQSLARTALDPAALADPPVTFTDTLTLPYVDPVSKETVYTVYYDLSTGDRVTSADDWDFSVECQEAGEELKDSGLVFFHTNSGDSGTESGAVWYTDETVFNNVYSHYQAVNVTGTEYEPYVNDVTRYAQGMGEEVYKTPMNIMTYFGFPGGDGLTALTAFEIIPYVPPEPLEDYIFYDFDKMAAYEGTGGMPPGFDATQQVYIIRHYDGTTYSKLQVNGFELDPLTLIYTIDLQFAIVQ